ncbi:MAG: leucine-rich repeat domain-containing protein [Planctomycetia bacterium]
MPRRRPHQPPQLGHRAVSRRSVLRPSLEQLERRWALATFAVGPLTYDTRTDGGVAVIRCDEVATAALIPATVTNPESGKPVAVKAIDSDAFARCKSLKNVTIPSSVTSIGRGAFRLCTALQSIAIPGSVETVEWETFYDCSSLTSVSLGEGVKTIEGFFDFSIPGDFPPWPEESVFWGAFHGCTSLTSITLPASLTNFDQTAFANTGLQHIDVAAGSTTYGSFDGILSDAAISTVTWCPSGRQRDVVLPTTVTSVPAGVFSNCRDITRIHVAQGNPAFAGIDGILVDRSLSTVILCPRGRKGSL